MKYLLFFWLFPLMNMDTCNTQQQAQVEEQDSVELFYLVREAKDPNQAAPLLILLQGFGSNEADLFSLADQVPEEYLVVSARAPITIAPNKYKWYDVKLVNDKITMNFEDEERSRTSILHLIDDLTKKYSIDQKKIITAGFSQGANMALAVSLTEPNKVVASACFSGRFMEEIKPLITNKEGLQSKNVFIAHGTKDSMLPMHYADENQATIEKWGVSVTRSVDNVAHTISKKHFTDFLNWLKTL